MLSGAQLVLTCDTSRYRESSHVLLQQFDGVDLDGDGVADMIFNGGYGGSNDDRLSIALDDDGRAVVSASLRNYGGMAVVALADVTAVCCGDGATRGGEECDVGAESAACDSDCTLPVCGDGLLNEAAGETCDDGNAAAGDGCSATCTMETDDDALADADDSAGGCSVHAGHAASGTTASWAVLALALAARRRREGGSAVYR